MATETKTKTETETGSSKLARQVRWSLVAIAIVVLAVLSGRQPETTSHSGTDQPGGCTVTVTADVLNVRAGPGTEFAMVDRLARNAVVPAERETSGAFRKLADNRWVASEFVQTSAGCAEQP